MTHSPSRHSSFPRVLALLLLATACEKSVVIGPLPVAQANPCPTVGPASIDSAHHVSQGLRATLIANGYCNFFIPEYHDEQRLSNGGRDYGPITYSFAYQAAGGYNDHAAFDNAWVNVAIVHVAAGRLYPPYNALNLESGTNCLFLKHEHEDANRVRWRAAIGQPPQSGGLCSSVTTARRIPMVAEPPVANAADYPPVTRFEEGRSRVPGIGVKCANEWCIVGPANGNDVIPPAFAGLPGQGTSSRWKVRGWFDDQTLGVLDAAGLHGILPGVRLAIVPDDNLGAQTVATFAAAGANNTWVPVARVLIPATVILPAKYAGRNPGFGLAAGVNTLWIRANAAAGGGYTWQGRVTNPAIPGGEYIYAHPVKWTDHSSANIPVPATARWRWSDADEEIWVRCDVGCCMIEGGFQ